MIRMMQWVTFVSLGLVLTVSTTRGEDDAFVDDVANYSSVEFFRPCVPGEFQCQDGQCIPLAALCDYGPHCNDHADEEQDCKCEYHCQSGRYSWWDGSRDAVYSCIQSKYVCDGLADCMDGEDEADCECAFRCDAGYLYKLHYEADRRVGCLSSGSVCDGVMDCVDGQDEQNCPCDFQCTSGRQCIRQWRVCNNWIDCDGGEDEENCPCEYKCEKGAKGHYDYYYGDTDRSYSGQCIKLNYVCNKVPDCVDGQDEVGCNY